MTESQPSLRSFTTDAGGAFEHEVLPALGKRGHCPLGDGLARPRVVGGDAGRRTGWCRRARCRGRSGCTGISASCARLSESSQPEPSVADSRITSTPSSTNDVKASICDFWSRLVAGAYFRSKPASLVNVSCMFASLAARQAPSGPTATKPTVTRSPPPRSPRRRVVVAPPHAASPNTGRLRPRGAVSLCGFFMLPSDLLLEIRCLLRRDDPVPRPGSLGASTPLCALTLRYAPRCGLGPHPSAPPAAGRIR